MKVAVIGATGRAGVICVQELLSQGHFCKAIVRSSQKAYDVFTCIPKNQRSSLEVIEVVDLENGAAQLREAFEGCDSVIFTACGLSFLGIFNRTSAPKRVDFGGVKASVEALLSLTLKNESDSPPESPQAPKFVLISSLGVTRPYWPIYIMLNTLGGRIMTWKLRGEDAVRSAADRLDYTIIRSGRLMTPERAPKLAASEFVVDQGDKITGQILRRQLAQVAVAVALNRSLANKSTLELISGESDEGSIQLQHRGNVEKALGRSKDPQSLFEFIKSDLQMTN